MLTKTYCTYEAVDYCGRGRPPNPRIIVDKDLKYAQVCKERNSKGKVLQITTKIVLGSDEEIMAIIRKNGRSKTINTAFVESRNGKYRKDDVRLARQTLCHSKKAIYHDAHIDLLTAAFNYCRPNMALKVVINPNAARFEQKYSYKSPAMAEGLTDKILNFKELLTRRGPNITLH